MWKKLMLLCLAAAITAGCNLKLCCKVYVNGSELEGLYSPAAVNESMSVVSAAAEEMLAAPCVMPDVRREYRLSFIPADGDNRIITDAALRAVTGVKLGQGVFINGIYLGCVEDGSQLFRHLRDFIRNQMPNAAVFGNISGRVEVVPIYSRANSEVPYDDMVLLISGIAPVVYTDQNGKLV